MEGYSPNISSRATAYLYVVTTDTYENLSSNYSTEESLTVSGLQFDSRIPLFSIIFLLSVVGNGLVIITLAQNRWMRTVTNVFLLNLSVSDLLLAVFCMPFTLIPTLLRDFIFGKVMCVMIRYLQGVSVAVSVFTLVAISLERYFAICKPFQSRRWQTLSHSYKTIAVIWLLSLATMCPTAIFTKFVRIDDGRHKCMEEWISVLAEKMYTIFLDVLLLLLPLIIMLSAYGKMSATLWRGMKQDMRSVHELRELRPTANDEETDEEAKPRMTANGDSKTTANGKSKRYTSGRSQTGNSRRDTNASHGQSFLRQSNTERSLIAKKRVIRMLFVVVLEFFVCWAPTWVLQTWFTFDKVSAMKNVSPMAVNFFHLLSYVSACCNPITYCFMNRKFRQGFLAVLPRRLRCCRDAQAQFGMTVARHPSGYTRTSIKTGKHDKNRRHKCAHDDAVRMEVDDALRRCDSIEPRRSMDERQCQEN